MGAFQAKDAYDPYSAIASANANANEQPMPATEAPVNGTGTEKNLMRSPSERDVTNMTAEDMGRRKFEDHYSEGKQIGYGAFAVVFIGTNKEFNKTYAIKKIDRSKMMWGGRDALNDEINNLRALREGPNIVKLYDEFYNKDDCYLVMELMVGGELFDRIIEKRTFSELEARAVAKCMLEALDYMHTKQVVHRDLKPENLLLPTREKDTNIKLADFGFAKKILERNGCRTLCGTPGYLAPEILERWPAYGTKCDLWSVGVILFLLLGGYLPFEDDNEDKVFDRTRNGLYKFHPEYWGHVSGSAKELVTKLLTINPSNRFSAHDALNHKYMVASNKQALEQSGVDIEKLKESLASARKRLKAAVNTVVVANRLQVLSEGFNKYLEHKRGDEPTFKVRQSMNPNAEVPKLDSEEGKPFDTFYSLGELLGEGGFASVYQVTHKKPPFEKFACKKVLLSKLPAGASGALKDEILALKLLRGGPHIVRLHDVFEEVEVTYMIMEEMRGGKLLQRIVEKEVYTEREARQTVKILFDALDYCHKKMIAHRDIKPENLLLEEKDDDTSIKIADFGFAKRVVKKNSLRTLCGTAAYVAPEILDLKSKGYDERADMWSCGVVTFILLGGYAPFEGPIEELALTILKGDYEFHDEYWSSISRGAKDLVSSLLQVNPEIRITAEEALQNEWMTADGETLTIKDLSTAQKKMERSLPVEKLRGAVKAVVMANKLTSLGDSFKDVLDTSGAIKRDKDGQVLEKSVVNIGDDFDPAVEDDSAKGAPFSELYILGKQLGSGAFSTVYEANHSQSNNPYAIKCVRRNDLQPSDAVALQDEITALKVLADCPYIVKIQDVFEETDIIYVVLERMDGGDLIDRIIERAHYSEGDAREVCRQLLFGVEFCHSRKIANRNLKPENLLLMSKTSDIDVKISDFGYAKKVLFPNSLRTQCGTEGYVAPEILEHRPAYDVKCDMWSLGVIIYIVLGGYRPFRGESDELMKRIRYGNYKFHPKYWSHVSDDAKNLIRGLLTVDPDKRLSASDALKSTWINADVDALGKTDLATNQEQLKDFKPKAAMRRVVNLIIATNKLQSLGSQYRAFQDF